MAKAGRCFWNCFQYPLSDRSCWNNRIKRLMNIWSHSFSILYRIVVVETLYWDERVQHRPATFSILYRIVVVETLDKWERKAIKNLFQYPLSDRSCWNSARLRGQSTPRRSFSILYRIVVVETPGWCRYAHCRATFSILYRIVVVETPLHGCIGRFVFLFQYPLSDRSCWNQTRMLEPVMGNDLSVSSIGS